MIDAIGPRKRTQIAEQTIKKRATSYKESGPFLFFYNPLNALLLLNEPKPVAVQFPLFYD